MQTISLKMKRLEETIKYLKNKNIIIVVLYFIFAVILLSLWQYFGDKYNNVRLFISSPSLIVNYFTINLIDLSKASLYTLSEAIIGLICAIFISLFMMILCFYSNNFKRFIMPLIVSSQVVPLIVLAPFFIMLLGTGIEAKVAMASIMSFFPIFINFNTGVISIKKEIIEYAYINNTTKYNLIRKIYFPLSLPNIITGIRISSTLSVIGAIVAEFSGANYGIGKNLFISAMRLEPEMMMTSLFLSILIGLFLYNLIGLFDFYLLKWQRKNE